MHARAGLKIESELGFFSTVKTVISLSCRSENNRVKDYASPLVTRRSGWSDADQGRTVRQRGVFCRVQMGQKVTKLKF